MTYKKALLTQVAHNTDFKGSPCRRIGHREVEFTAVGRRGAVGVGPACNAQERLHVMGHF